jgi:hypothetical protein
MARIEQYNETSNRWYQIIQCPPGTIGPLQWTTFKCQIDIPPIRNAGNDNNSKSTVTTTTEIRPVLNAGWSSQKNKEGITLFDDIDIRLNNP